jgi:uncharacterized protein (TIGR03083 family)
MTTTTALPRPYVAQGARAEYDAFADLVASLSDTEWKTPSRCDGFDVRDVAGHVIGLAEDVAAGKPGSRNAEEEAASVRDDTPAQAAARLRTALEPIGALLDAADDATWAAPVGVNDLTLGEGVLLLWYDVYVHADDIRAAIGRTSERGPGLDATIAYLAGQLTAKSWGPATLALDEVGRHDVSGGGREITGDALQFALVATGRSDASTIGLDRDLSIY